MKQDNDRNSREDARELKTGTKNDRYSDVEVYQDEESDALVMVDISTDGAWILAHYPYEVAD